MKLDLTSFGEIDAFIEKHIQIVPIISVEAENRIRVNDMLVINHDDQWIVKHKANILARFTLRSWAVAYAVALINKNVSVYTFLFDNEVRLSKLATDKHLYQHHMKSAIKRQDDVKRYIIEGRLSRTDREIHDLVDMTKQVLRYQQFG